MAIIILQQQLTVNSFNFPYTNVRTKRYKKIHVEKPLMNETSMSSYVFYTPDRSLHIKAGHLLLRKRAHALYLGPGKNM